ncbi:MAG: condensation domain-containing protein, partial [Actinocatenispora sp.]
GTGDADPGRADTGRAAPAGYGDLVAAERDAVERGLAAAEKYWSSVPLPLPAPLAVLTVRPRAEVRGYAGERYPFRWPEPRADRLRAFARAQRTSPFMVLLTAFLAALHTATGSRDLAVASLFAGRDRAEYETMIGLLAQATVFRPELSDDPTGAELLSRVRMSVLDAHEHARVPLRTVAGRILGAAEPSTKDSPGAPGRGPALARLFEVWFNLLPADAGELPLAGALMRPRPTAPQPVERDEHDWDGENVTLTLTATHPELRGHLDVNALLVSGSTAEGLLSAFGRALDRLVDDPGTPLSGL